jgi:hypothetical protein
LFRDFRHFTGEGAGTLFEQAPGRLAGDLEDQDPPRGAHGVEDRVPFAAGAAGRLAEEGPAPRSYPLLSMSQRVISLPDIGGAGISFRTPAGSPSAFSVASREAESLTNMVAAGVGDRYPVFVSITSPPARHSAA